MTSKWLRDDPKIIPKCSQNDPQMILKRFQNDSHNNPNIIPKWSQSDSQMIPNKNCKHVPKDAPWNSLSNDGIPVSNRLHFDKLRINIISQDRSHHRDPNGLEIIKIQQNLIRFWSVQSFKVQELLYHPKTCALKFCIEWWYRRKRTSFWWVTNQHYLRR